MAWTLGRLRAGAALLPALVLLGLAAVLVTAGALKSHPPEPTPRNTTPVTVEKPLAAK
jgi:hypothetical protein